MNFIFKNILLIILLFGMGSCGETDVKNKTILSKEKISNNSSGKPKPTSSKKKKQILFFGDSLTAGYGLEDPSESFVGVIQEKLDSLGLDYQTVNAGVSGETSSGGNDRINWILDQNTIDIFILELGANDGLRGIQNEETVKNLQSIFDKVKAKFPEAKLMVAGMLAPPNMGASFTKKFATIFPNLAKENNAGLVPFLLEDVGGIPELNQRDGIHPTSKGHKILAKMCGRFWKTFYNIFLLLNEIYKYEKE